VFSSRLHAVTISRNSEQPFKPEANEIATRSTCKHAAARSCSLPCPGSDERRRDESGVQPDRFFS
jgi:hypothetical protein